MSILWDETIWLPAGVKWSEMKSNATISYPNPADLKYTLVGGVILLIIRVLLESFVFLPIGYFGGWVTTPLLPRMWSHLTGGFYGKTKFKRVAECAWRFTFFITAWVAGYFLLRDAPQLEDVANCWRNWPYHHVSEGTWWYYIIETSFYWALFIGTWFFDVRRADFMQMMLHHGITILLLTTSWTMNMVRVGALVLFIHDAADIFIELTKILRYAGWHTIVSILFVLFLIVWIGTRLVYYPFWVLQSIWFDAPALMQKSYRWENLWQKPIVPRLLMVMLSLLLILHIFWTIVILKVAYLSTKSGAIDDVREDSDSEEESAVKDKKKIN